MKFHFLRDIPFWVTFHFKWHSFLSDIQFSWHSILNDFPFWVTFQFEWHSILSNIPFSATFHFEWHFILSDILSWVTFLFKASALWADAFYKSKCSSVCLSVCLFVCSSVRLFTFEVPFKHLFAPTSWSRMSNIFRASESSGKSNGKKWSQILKKLFRSGPKSPRWFCLTKHSGNPAFR